MLKPDPIDAVAASLPLVTPRTDTATAPTAPAITPEVTPRATSWDYPSFDCNMRVAIDVDRNTLLAVDGDRANDRTIAGFTSTQWGSGTDALRRACACINACRGIETAALVAADKPLSRFVRSNQDLIEKNRKLAQEKEGLQKSLADYQTDSGHSVETAKSLREALREALDLLDRSGVRLPGLTDRRLREALHPGLFDTTRQAPNITHTIIGFVDQGVKEVDRG